MSVVLPTYADEDRIKQDINEVGTTDTVILNHITRANEDASSKMEALFLNNFDENNPEAFFVQITTELATAEYWVKTNGTQEALNQRDLVLKKAQDILIQRFQPVESRVT